MFKKFLSHSHTTALCDRDFKEWHQGIPHYGFWAIIIDNPNILDVIAKAQAHLSRFLLPNYKRQAHITLNACGLLAETHFSKAILARQIASLESLKLASFNITLGSINSFSTAAYMSISDQHKALSTLNTTLSNIHSDSSPSNYTPHITLGLYKEEFACNLLVDEFLKFENTEKLTYRVNKVQFCRYQTAHIQGPIEIVREWKLD